MKNNFCFSHFIFEHENLSFIDVISEPLGDVWWNDDCIDTTYLEDLENELHQIRSKDVLTEKDITFLEQKDYTDYIAFDSRYTDWEDWSTVEVYVREVLCILEDFVINTTRNELQKTIEQVQEAKMYKRPRPHAFVI